MTSLKEARRKRKIEEFIQEREKDAPGDMDKLDAAIGRPSEEKSKSGQEASTPGSDDD